MDIAYCKTDNINCPLCCQKTFPSKETLVAHLKNVTQNILCPICQAKFATSAELLEHLTSSNCEISSSESVTIVNNNIETKSEDIHVNSNIQLCNFDNDVSDVITTDGESGSDHDVIKMYVELLRNQFAKPSVGSQEVKFVEDGDNRYMIVTSGNSDSLAISKQVNGGAICILNPKEINMKLNDSVHEDQAFDDNQDPTYSCSSCGVTFKSVLEHIQNYHSGQDVVVEEPVDSTGEESTLTAYISSDKDESDNRVSRRVITNTGDIVETPISHSFSNVEEQNTGEEQNSNPSVEIADMKQTQTEKVTEQKQLKTKTVNSKKIIEVDEVAVGQGIDGEETNKEENSNPPLQDANIKQSPTKKVTEQKQLKQNKAPNKQNNSKKILKVNKAVGQGANINKDTQTEGPYHSVVVKEMITVGDNAEGKKIKVYNCMSCHLYVTNLEDFKKHACKKTFNCSHCPEVFDDERSLLLHVAKVHKLFPTQTNAQDSKDEFKCEVCSIVFPTNKSLKLHKRMHDPIKSRPLELPVELEPTDIPDDDRWYLCPTCNKLIPIDYRTVHQDSHLVDNTFNCEICNKKFENGEYLLMHMKVHNVDKPPVPSQDKSLPYTCMYCSKQFARPHEKVKHERIHTGEKPHSCEICGKSFRVSYCLTLHMRTHTGARPYACHHCPKRFKAHSVFNHHLLTHSEVRAYKCPFCPKAFKTSVQLAGHKNSHTKPFSCQHCNRPFASLYAVRVHTETHLRPNNLRYSCALCGASYARAFALSDHVRQTHPDHTNVSILPTLNAAADTTNANTDANNEDNSTSVVAEKKEEVWFVSDSNEEQNFVEMPEITELEINNTESENVVI